MAPPKPRPPLHHTLPKQIELDLSSFVVDVQAAEQARQKAFDTSQEFKVKLIVANSALKSGVDTTSAAKVLDEAFASIFPAEADRNSREANLSSRVEDYVQFKAYTHFLETGELLSPSACGWATDEEYLAGACMGLAQQLQQYAMGRATARDADSVHLARNLVRSILEMLMEFDFRNGPLRRKYDGTKYSLKTLETLLYELSVTGTVVQDDAETEEPDSKRMKIDPILLNKDELDELRKRIEHRDEIRETLIKKSRDGQKAAKQAIYALHRNDQKKAKELLDKCLTCINKDLLPIVNEEPPLRHGSFANVLEEYAEAKLFYAWLYGKEESASGGIAAGDVLLPTEFDVFLKPEEYLGGLCDLTGEIGRFAVKQGTARDKDSVKLSLHTNSIILKSLQIMGRLPGGINKKMDQLNRSVEKLERMLYEMSLSEATGRTVTTGAGDSMEVVNGDS